MHNGNGSAALHQGAVPILVGGQRYRCPKCGDEPANASPGVPQAMVTTKVGEAPPPVYLCIPCYENWQVDLYRANVPALEPITSGVI